MNKAQEKLIQQSISELPENIQLTLESLDWRTIIKKIGQHHRLNAQHLDQYETETALVLVGLSEPGGYFTELTKRVGIPKKVAEKIVHDVGDKLFGQMAQNIQEAAVEIRADIEKNKSPLEKAAEELKIDERVQVIGKQHSIHIDDMQIIYDRVHEVIDGELPSEKFDDALFRDIHDMSRAQIEVLVGDINTQIFVPLQELQQKYINQQSAKKEESVPSVYVSQEPVNTSNHAAPSTGHEPQELTLDEIRGHAEDGQTITNQKMKGVFSLGSKQEKRSGYETDPYIEEV